MNRPRLDSSFCVVLRCAGERTQFEAANRLMDQSDDVVSISVAPFSDAVRKCYQLAIDRAAKWLVTCDADVLVDADAAEQILRIVKLMPSEAWQAIGQVNDKLAGCVRLGGLRIHRVSALPKAIMLVNDVAIRPEADLCLKMPNWVRARVTLGSHDFEQWYRDLYRKGAQHRKKHPTWARSIAHRWRASHDLDLRAAGLGWDGHPPPDWPEKGPL